MVYEKIINLLKSINEFKLNENYNDFLYFVYDIVNKIKDNEYNNNLDQYHSYKIFNQKLSIMNEKRLYYKFNQHDDAIDENILSEIFEVSKYNYTLVNLFSLKTLHHQLYNEIHHIMEDVNDIKINTNNITNVNQKYNKKQRLIINIFDNIVELHYNKQSADKLKQDIFNKLEDNIELLSTKELNLIEEKILLSEKIIKEKFKLKF